MLTSESDLEIHLAGKKHAKKVKMAQAVKKINKDAESGQKMVEAEAGVETATSETADKAVQGRVPSSVSAALFCDVCQVTTNSPDQMQIHLMGASG